MSTQLEEATRVKKTCKITDVFVKFDGDNGLTKINTDIIKGLVWTDADVPHRGPNPGHGEIEVAICKEGKKGTEDMCVLVGGDWKC